MKSKGFTLIELLAIIVILAIIAVITTPIILNIIENSKKGAITNSAYGYKEAIEKNYLSKLSENHNYMLNGTYSISNGKFKNEEISLSGSIPTSGSLTYKNNILKSGCLQFDEYKVDIIDGKINNAIKGECEKPGPTYIPPKNMDTHMGIVYLDPTNIDNTCNESKESKNRNEKHSIVKVKTGCMKWYIFSELNIDNNNDGVITDDEKFYNLILDHNTSVGIEWTNYKEEDNYVNYKGPREALYQLYEDTKDWTGINNLTQNSNYTASWEKDGNKTYTIDYTKHLSRTGEENNYTYTLTDGAHKARLITAEEIAQITGIENWTTSSSYFFLDNNETGYNGRTNTNPSNYAWLFENLNECKSHGCINESISYSGNYGYWTSSPVGYTLNNAWTIEYGGRNYDLEIKKVTSGIRPVITIPKSILDI